MNKSKPKFTTHKDSDSHSDSQVLNSENKSDQQDKQKSNTITGLFDKPLVAGLSSYVNTYLNTNYVNELVSELGSKINTALSTVSDHKFLQNDTNRGWLLVISSVLGTFFLISMLWKFIFNFMLSYASVKIVLWFLEHYSPDDKSNEVVSDHYVSETSPVDVIEYLVVLLFVTALTPFSYLPYMSFMVNSSCVMISITALASKEYRRKICRFIKDSLVSPEYKPGKKMEGKVHSSLQTFCHTIETLNIGTFNITHNSRTVYTDLKTSNSFTDGLRKLTQKPLNLLMSKNKDNSKKNKTQNTSQNKSQSNSEDGFDDLDESFD